MALKAKERANDEHAQREAKRERFMASIRRVQAEFAAAPVLDPRSPKEIMDELNEDILASH